MAELKPYPKYKDSGIAWIGDVPEGWVVACLKHLVGLRNLKNNDEDTEMSYIGLENIEAYTGRYVYTSVSARTMMDSTVSVFMAQDVLYGKLRPYLKKIFIPSYGGFCSSEFLVLIPKKFFVSYLQYLLLTDDITQEIEKNCEGAKMPRTNWDFMGSLAVPVPSSSEQQAIAAFLDRETGHIDTLITKKQRSIELLNEKRQATITHAVTKGLDANAPMKDSGIEWIGEVPDEWKIGKMLHALAMPITDGPHETPEFFSTGIPFLSAEAVKNGALNFTLMRGYISTDYYNQCCKKYIPKIHDIYMVKSGATTGNIALVETNQQFQIWSPLAVFRCNSKMYYKFLYYYLDSESLQKQVQFNWSYGTQQNIGMRVLEQLFCVFPIPTEQQVIADYLDTQCAKIDDLITKTQRSIELLKEKRQSLITAAVTGKIDVREAVC